MTGAEQSEAGRRADLLLAAIEFSGDSIITGTLDGVITSWNPAAERLFGYTRQEIIGKPSILLSPKDRVEETGAVLAKVGRGQVVENLETRRIRRDGTVLPVCVTFAPIFAKDGAVVGITAIHRDDSDRRLAFETAQRMASIVENSADAIIAKTLDGIITSWNPAAEAMYGYSAQEIIGQPIDLLTTVEGSEEVESILARGMVPRHR
jgi:PAS domain S-box-containing protein